MSVKRITVTPEAHVPPGSKYIGTDYDLNAVFEVPTDKPKYDGGPAFPTAPEVLPAADGQTFHRRAYENCDNQQGMSLRDYFAAQALTAELTARGGAGNCNIDDLANDCYLIADTILLVRKS